MSLLHALILGIVQGITEFLPISSSGHLVLFEHWFGLEVSELRSFDVVVHVGTLLAILIYFRADIMHVIKDTLKGRFQMAAYLIIGTIPAVFAGFTFKDQLDSYFRDPGKVAIAMACAAILFIIAEYVGENHQAKKLSQKRRLTTGKAPVGKLAPQTSETTESQLSWPGVILIGILQSAALIAGVSRSGSTISAGLLSGMTREVAARFSFLLGSIAIFGAGLLTTKDVVSEGLYFPGMDVALVGFFASLISGYISVAFLMKFLKSNTLHVFAIYLFLVAGTVLYLH